MSISASHTASNTVDGPAPSSVLVTDNANVQLASSITDLNAISSQESSSEKSILWIRAFYLGKTKTLKVLNPEGIEFDQILPLIEKLYQAPHKWAPKFNLHYLGKDDHVPLQNHEQWLESIRFIRTNHRAYLHVFCSRVDNVEIKRELEPSTPVKILPLPADVQDTTIPSLLPPVDHGQSYGTVEMENTSLENVFIAPQINSELAPCEAGDEIEPYQIPLPLSPMDTVDATSDEIGSRKLLCADSTPDEPLDEDVNDGKLQVEFRDENGNVEEMSETKLEIVEAENSPVHSMNSILINDVVVESEENITVTITSPDHASSVASPTVNDQDNDTLKVPVASQRTPPPEDTPIYFDDSTYYPLEDADSFPMPENVITTIEFQIYEQDEVQRYKDEESESSESETLQYEDPPYSPLSSNDPTINFQTNEKEQDIPVVVQRLPNKSDRTVSKSFAKDWNASKDVSWLRIPQYEAKMSLIDERSPLVSVSADSSKISPKSSPNRSYMGKSKNSSPEIPPLASGAQTSPYSSPKSSSFTPRFNDLLSSNHSETKEKVNKVKKRVSFSEDSVREAPKLLFSDRVMNSIMEEDADRNVRLYEQSGFHDEYEEEQDQYQDSPNIIYNNSQLNGVSVDSDRQGIPNGSPSYQFNIYGMQSPSGSHLGYSPTQVPVQPPFVPSGAHFFPPGHGTMIPSVPSPVTPIYIPVPYVLIPTSILPSLYRTLPPIPTTAPSLATSPKDFELPERPHSMLDHRQMEQAQIKLMKKPSHMRQSSLPPPKVRNPYTKKDSYYSRHMSNARPSPHPS
jgi:hypothetical protein